MMDIMDSGVVQANMSKDDVVATCQAMYNAAFATIENNKPSSKSDSRLVFFPFQVVTSVAMS